MKATSTGRITPRGRRPLLRFGAAAAAGVILAAVVPGLAGSKETEFIPGSGNAYAQIYRVGPTAARLSLAPVIGLSLSDFLNTEGRAAATVADWAAIGVSSKELPENTPTVRVVSTQKDADKGTTQIVAGGKDAGGNGGGLMELFARATKAPLGQSHFRLQSFAVPGIVELNGGEAATSSGVFNQAGGKVRISTATVTINGLDIGGSVKMSGLRWEAIQKTDANNKRSLSGKFTIQGASIAGAPIPIPTDPNNVKPVFDAINQALAPIGFSITVPVFSGEGGVAEIAPLQLQIVDSPLGRQYLAPILADFREQEAVKALIDRYIALSEQIDEDTEEDVSAVPNLTVAVLAADLTLGILSGLSQLHIELGGANAFTEGTLYASAFGPGGFRPPPIGPTTLNVPGTLARPGVPGTPGTKDTGQLASSLPPAQRTIPGDKGGLAIAVGLAGMLAAVALATRDYWKMRQRRAELAG